MKFVNNISKWVHHYGTVIDFLNSVIEGFLNIKVDINLEGKNFWVL